MNIILNNNNEAFEAETLSITELLALKKFTFKMLIIKINGNLVKQENYASSFIKDGDDVMVLHLISGG
jgi:thiamine biosynthesis protein ThiS